MADARWIASMNRRVYAGLYRNKMRDVQSFLKEKHHATGYCVYNLCAEEQFAYKPFKFEQVASFPFEDHQVGSPLIHWLFKGHD